MLDPSLPWLAVGYRNFKQQDFCQRQIRDEMSKYGIDTADVGSVLRSSTPQCQQRRLVKSATAARLASRSCDSLAARPTPRPKSARPYRPPLYQGTDRSRQLRPRSALPPHHRPSAAQNRSVTAVERQHHSEKTIRLYVDERHSKCAFCPVECRPKSSSSNRPTSSTGLVAARVPSHFDRYVFWTRPRTAPATRRDFLQLPRHNNIRRGSIPHYTNFVRRVELGLRDGTPSPLLRRRMAFEEESARRQSPAPEAQFQADWENGESVLSDESQEGVIDDEIDEDVSIRIPTPIEPPLDYDSEDEPTDEGQEAQPEPKAPTPSPAVSGRNSPEPETAEIEQEEAPTPREPTPCPLEPSPPPRDVSPPPREPTPLPRDPTPPPREPTPPPLEPTPPPREPSPPPKEPTPLPQEPTPPPREPTPPPLKPTPPPREPKPKKEVRILEMPVPPPAKPKTVPQNLENTTRSCLVRKPKIPKETEPQPKAPSSEPTLEEVTEDAIQVEEPPEESEAEQEEVAKDALTNLEEASELEDTQPEQTSNSEESVADRDGKPEKTKLGPPPKYKVDLLPVDSQDLLDMEMRMKRKGPESHMTDGDSAPPDIPEHLLRRKQPWQAGRLALSRRACRFEIPMDVRRLETMSPTEYLQRYCVVSKRRKAMYRRAFGKADRSNRMKINRKEFNSAIVEALVDTVSATQIQDVLELVEADAFPDFGPKLFCAICALLERLHYRDYVTEDTIDQENLVAKERIEDADFLALDWKLEGCVINTSLKHLLYIL